MQVEACQRAISFLKNLESSAPQHQHPSPLLASPSVDELWGPGRVSMTSKPGTSPTSLLAEAPPRAAAIGRGAFVSLLLRAMPGSDWLERPGGVGAVSAGAGRCRPVGRGEAWMEPACAGKGPSRARRPALPCLALLCLALPLFAIDQIKCPLAILTAFGGSKKFAFRGARSSRGDAFLLFFFYFFLNRCDFDCMKETWPGHVSQVPCPFPDALWPRGNKCMHSTLATLPRPGGETEETNK